MDISQYMNPPVVVDEDGDLYYEPYTHTYVRCRKIDILRAKYELNRTFTSNGRACLGDFLKWLHIDSDGIGHSLGWENNYVAHDCAMTWIDIIEEQMSEDCYMISYIFEPSLMYPSTKSQKSQAL